ncbi:MAG: hypothetical protein RIC80_02695 [Cyclobacteriaceae bacterium]
MAIITINVFVIVYIREEGFPAEDRVYWRQVTWDDFQGTPLIPNRFDASIATYIDLEYDSVFQKTVARASMSPKLSWKNEGMLSEHLLRHEQYHFNLTEVYARQMSNIIKAKPNESTDFYESKRDSLVEKLKNENQMYDTYTDHGTIIDQQRFWEFDIDLSLRLYSDDGIGFTDMYTGVRMDFLREPEPFMLINEIDELIMGHVLQAYGMSFLSSVIVSDYIDHSNFEEYIKFHYEDDVEIISVEWSLSDSLSIARVWATNSVKQREILDKWILKDTELYRLNCQYSTAGLTATGGFNTMSDIFLNSFEVVDVTGYWDRLLDNVSSPYSNDWFGETKAGYFGFSGRYSFSDKGDLIIPYLPFTDHRPVKLSMAIVDQQKLFFSDSNYLYSFKIDSENIPEKDFIVSVGHLHYEDSNMDTSIYYYHNLVVESR